MFTSNNFYNLPTLVYTADPHTTLVRAALDAYQRAHIEGRLRRVFAALSGRRTSLENLEKLAAEGRVVSRHHAGVRSVSLRQIGGSEGRSEDFDDHFNPLRCHTQQRWVNVMLARKLDVPLPPVELIQVGDAYFVRDGHHRLSVAQALGETCIDAEVTVWSLAEAAAPASPSRTMPKWQAVKA